MSPVRRSSSRSRPPGEPGRTRLRLVDAPTPPPVYALAALALWQADRGQYEQARHTWLQLEREAGGTAAAEFARWAQRRLPAPTADGAGLDVQVLGGFNVRQAEGLTCRWQRPLAARVLRFLLVHRGGPVPEDLLFEAFWPGREPEAARRSLTVALSLTRRGIGEAQHPASRITSSQRCHELILTGDDRVDSDAFEAAARMALRTGAMTDLERATDLWTGEPLPQERYSAWAVPWRERLLGVRLEVLVALTRAYTDTGRHLDAARIVRERLADDPLDEAAHCDLIAAYARSGRRDRALEHFHTCRRVLLDGLGVEPAQATRELYDRVLRGERVAS